MHPIGLVRARVTGAFGRVRLGFQIPRYPTGWKFPVYGPKLYLCPIRNDVTCAEARASPHPKLLHKLSIDLKQLDYCRRGTVLDGLVVREEELTGGMGRASPAVWEPNPSF